MDTFLNRLIMFVPEKKLGCMMPTIRDTASIITIMALLLNHLATASPFNFLVASTIDSLLIY